jgi:hypothetical protein
MSGSASQPSFPSLVVSQTHGQPLDRSPARAFDPSLSPALMPIHRHASWIDLRVPPSNRPATVAACRSSSQPSERSSGLAPSHHSFGVSPPCSPPACAFGFPGELDLCTLTSDSRRLLPPRRCRTIPLRLASLADRAALLWLQPTTNCASSVERNFRTVQPVHASANPVLFVHKRSQ